MQTTESGWKPIPLSLKILFVLFVLWAVGSVFALPGRVEQGLPFFGVFVYGVIAGSIVLVLDIAGPLGFLFGLWKRRSWAVLLAFAYISVFVLNSAVALFTVREQLGLMPILIPMLLNIVFLIIIFINKNYFE